MLFTNCHDAILVANAQKNTCIGWNTTKKRWVLYSPKSAAPDDTVPEFFCIRSGSFPIALSESGLEILKQLTKGK